MFCSLHSFYSWIPWWNSSTVALIYTLCSKSFRLLTSADMLLGLRMVHSYYRMLIGSHIDLTYGDNVIILSDFLKLMCMRYCLHVCRKYMKSFLWCVYFVFQEAAVQRAWQSYWVCVSDRWNAHLCWLCYLWITPRTPCRSNRHIGMLLVVTRHIIYTVWPKTMPLLNHLCWPNFIATWVNVFIIEFLRKLSEY